MKCEWNEILLESVITDIAAGPFGSRLKVSSFVQSGFPIIDGANLKGFKVTDNITKFVTEEKARSLSRSIAKRNDVVVTISGTLGQVAYVPWTSRYPEYLCSQRQFRVTFDAQKVCVPYLVYYFHTHEGQNKILSFANQTGVPALAQPLKNFRKIRVNLPDIETQKRIVSVLSSLDDKIELNNKINANLERQAQALFKAWFVDFEPFGGKMPEDWQEIPLEKLCEVVTKGTTPTTLGKPFTEQGVNFIKGESIQENHTFDLQKMSHISDETNQLLKRSIIYSDDILFTIAGTLGRFAMVDEDLLPANTNQAVCIIRSSSERVSPIFLYSFFIGNWHNEFYAKRVQQAVQQNLSLGTIKSLPILIPPSKELGVYCDLLGPILKQVKQNEIENRRLTMLRNVLLPRLMSGKVLV